MIAKICTYGRNRESDQENEAAIQKPSFWVSRPTLGHLDILAHEQFVNGRYDTSLLTTPN